MVIVITVMSFADAPKYVRSQWIHWSDLDRDCQDTRQEVLIAESLVPVTLDSRGCKVIKGRWFGVYTGKFYTNPKVLDIDHLVPLKHAHISGAHSWSRAEKKAFANSQQDPRHLIAVYRGANRSKGAKAPHEWMPKYKAYWCFYLEDWVETKYDFKLTLSSEERSFITSTLKTQGCLD
jgi:hypothetical protein